ncbi:MAG: hypothetical protein WAV45_09915 [Propionibacteriaceae bacterium]|jgi:hypothetical protein|nr:hypothetical protein [Micropruina sp.]HBX82837.1 hypothetical protein [Propionibacteriaceae bacterium]HBY23415.1 hypothetical protein [Propionibacteriaceae bacterium]
MGLALFVWIGIIALAVIIIGAVAVGMQGAGASRNPELADRLGRAVAHLNGDAEPPRGLVEFFGELPDGQAVREKISDSIPGRKN